MKCDCAKKMVEKIKETHCEFEDVYPPIELISGRMYINFTGTKKVKGKKKDVDVPILLSKCPFCGMKQTDD